MQPTSGPFTLPTIQPTLVCGPNAFSGVKNATLANAGSGLIAVLYKCAGSSTSLGCQMVEQLTNAAGAADLLSTVKAGKAFAVQASAPLAAGSYEVLLFSSSMTPMASINKSMDAGQALAPIQDSGVNILQGPTTLKVDSTGKVSATVSKYNVLVETGSNQNLSSACSASSVGMIDPLMIDFSGRGIKLSSQANGLDFDLTGDGEPEKISWPVNRLNMFLIHGDVPSTGEISGADFFGNYSVGPDGKIAADGFAALKKYDLNEDNVIDAYDPIFSDLRLWADVNRDGLAEPRELKTLPEMGVVSIELEPIQMSEKDAYGNETTLRAVVNMVGGHRRVINDVWFKPQN